MLLYVSFGCAFFFYLCSTFQMDEERDEAERLRRQIDRLKTELERERVCYLILVTGQIRTCLFCVSYFRISGKLVISFFSDTFL